jgi:hypothetical protein
MDVSTERPPETAAAEQPLPSCRVIRLDASAGVAVRAE